MTGYLCATLQGNGCYVYGGSDSGNVTRKFSATARVFGGPGTIGNASCEELLNPPPQAGAVILTDLFS